MLEDVGIFDRTHLRWFAEANLAELFDGTELKIRSVGRVRRLRPYPSRWNRLAPWIGDWGTFQFLVVAARSS